MKLPAWARVRRQQQVGRTVVVDLEIDTSRFVAAMDQAAESVRVMRYRRRIDHERNVGLAQVGTLLDGLCRDFGLHPVEAWRLPRELERRARRDQADWTAYQRALLATLGTKLELIDGGVA